jgi:hypothetical protein
MSSTDCSDEEDVVACYYFRRRKQDKILWVYPHLEKNIRCRLFTAAKEFQETCKALDVSQLLPQI